MKCSSLQTLPAGLGRLAYLQSLSVMGCTYLTGLPGEIGQLSSLTNLAVVACKKCQLPSELGQLSCLQTLSIDEEALLALPYTLSMLRRLWKHANHGCSSLEGRHGARRVPGGLFHGAACAKGYLELARGWRLCRGWATRSQATRALITQEDEGEGGRGAEWAREVIAHRVSRTPTVFMNFPLRECMRLLLPGYKGQFNPYSSRGNTQPGSP